ncbi:MAG: hypothetical protein JSR34_11075 [Proteobacteria bacterium]|nr:hypothetical protein [Pseudomonadota bacterium]
MNEAMTANGHTRRSVPSESRPSLLPFDPADLMAMRVLPSEFARMCGVSKQTVSQWIKKGTVSLLPDGRLDPVRASRQVLQNTDPARLRARVFRQASASQEELRQRIRTLEGELKALREERQRIGRARHFQHVDATAAGLDRLACTIAARFDEAMAAHAVGYLEAWLDDLLATEFWGQGVTPDDRVDGPTLLAGSDPPASTAGRDCTAPDAGFPGIGLTRETPGTRES